MRTLVLFILSLLWLTPAAHAQDGPIGLSIPALEGTVGDTITVPVHVDSSLTGRDVLSYRTAFTFYADYLHVLDVETAGTLSDGLGGFEASVDSTSNRYASTVTVSAATTAPLTGTGDLYHVRVVLKRSGTVYLSFAEAPANLLNEGDPALTFVNGSIRIDARPTLSVSPRTHTLARGEQVDYNAYSASGPLTWSVADTTIATIDADGTVTALAPGRTTLAAEDTVGARGTAEVVVRGFRLSVRDTSAYPGREVAWPIHTSDLTGLDVLAGEIAFSLHGPVTIRGVETAGMLLDGADVQLNATATGARISFAGTDVIEGAGPLLALRIETAGTGGSASLSFEEPLFNESLLGLTTNGRFSVTQLPTVYVSPSNATLLAGETAAFTASGTTGPVTWSVSDPGKAAIDTAGVLTALQGGTVNVTATDSLGASGTAAVTLYDLDLRVPDLDGLAGDTLLIPVTASNLPAAEELLSLDATMTFDANLLTVLDVTTAGGIVDDWSLTSNLVQDGRLRIVAAGSTPAAADGPLFFLKVLPDTAVTYQRGTTLAFAELLLNEGAPTARTTNGRLMVLPAGTNRAPTSATVLPDLTLDAGFAAFTAADLDTVFSDPDSDDVLTYEVSASATVVTTSLDGSLLQLAPGATAAGSAVVTVIARDDGNASVQQSFTVTVVGSDNAPVFASTALSGGTVGTAYSYTAEATDADGDALTFTAPTLPAWLAFTDHGDGTATLAGTPDTAGDFAVVLDATDGTYTVQQRFTITVSPAPNAGPAFTSTPPTSAVVDVAYDYTAAATDPDGDVLTLTAPMLPAWLTFTDNGDGTAAVTGTPDAEGTYDVVLEVADGTAAVQQTFSITVAPAGSNSAPVFTSIAATDGTVGTAYSYTAEATDADGDALTFTAPTLPAWITFTDNGDGTATLAGTPDDAGTYDVVLDVTDGAASAQQTFSIAVAEAPEPASGAAYFDGTARIRVLDDAPVHPDADPTAYQITGTALTVEAWVYPTALPDDGDGYSLVRRPYMDDPWQSFGLWINNYGEGDNPVFALEISSGAAGNAAFVAGPRPELNTWIHVAGVYDGASAKLYVDGVLVGETPYTDPIGSGDVGLYVGGFIEQRFRGFIDEVRLWNVARTADEVAAAKDAPLAGTETGLVGYWPLDAAYDSADEILTADASAFHNDLVVQGARFVTTGFGETPAVAPTLPTFTDAALTAAVDAPFELVVDGIGGIPAPTVTLTDGPTGLSFDGAAISWTPTTDGAASFTLRAENTAGSLETTYTIWVNPEQEEAEPLATGMLHAGIYNNGAVGSDFQLDGAFGTVTDGGVQNALFDGTFVVAQSPDRTAGRVSSREAFFAAEAPVTPIGGKGPVPEAFDTGYETAFSDRRMGDDRLGVHVTHRAYSSSDVDFQTVLIVEYVVENIGAEPLADVYLGLALDWDIGDFYRNEGGCLADAPIAYAFETDGANDPNVYGVAGLSEGAFRCGVWSSEDQVDVDAQFAALNGQGSAVIDSPAELRQAVGYGPYTIGAGATQTVRFALVAAADKDGQADLAREAIALFESDSQTAAEPVAERPAAFHLEQNYPNPFNPTTTIRYALPSTAPVRLTVFDALGRTVQVLVDGIRPAGAHTVPFEAGALPSGVYFYRIETGHQTMTRRMLLLK